MNKEIEEIIVKSFFNKRIQQRVLFELSSPKKRWGALRGLRHKYYDTLRNEFMIEIPEPNSNFEKIAEMLKNHGAGEFCYSLSDCEEIDGKELPLLNA